MWMAKRPIVVQLTNRVSPLYTDRVTGKPVWPIEAAAVPVSDVRGEKSWPTQPSPQTPAFAPQEFRSPMPTI